MTRVKSNQANKYMHDRKPWTTRWFQQAVHKRQNIYQITSNYKTKPKRKPTREKEISELAAYRWPHAHPVALFSISMSSSAPQNHGSSTGLVPFCCLNWNRVLGDWGPVPMFRSNTIAYRIVHHRSFSNHDNGVRQLDRKHFITFCDDIFHL